MRTTTLLAVVLTGGLVACGGEDLQVPQDGPETVAAPDSGTPAPDARVTLRTDGGPDTGPEPSPVVEAGSDTGPDAGHADGGPDVVAPDSGPTDVVDAGPDTGVDAGTPAADAGPVLPPGTCTFQVPASEIPGLVAPIAFTHTVSGDTAIGGFTEQWAAGPHTGTGSASGNADLWICEDSACGFRFRLYCVTPLGSQSVVVAVGHYDSSDNAETAGWTDRVSGCPCITQ